ncbi:MAG: sodium:alanine symporter family protein [Clostridia bacterium]|nr:sodium:alanine symporter family protein [Clostridia bacterium]
MEITAFFTDGILLITLLGAGIFLTMKTGFVQIRCLGEGLKNTFRGLFSKDKQDGVSPFQALAASLAAQLGTGNIVGAGSAIMTGGPGALFWMWLSAFFGMATAYSESVLSQKTNFLLPDGSYGGGTAYYIRYAFRGKTGRLLSAVFSLFASIALGLTGTAVQSNSIAVSLNEALHIPEAVTGIALAVISGAVLFRGTVFLARLSEKAVPLMAIIYTAVCTLVIILNIEYLPEAVSAVFRYAFTPFSVAGGIAGISVKTAVSQGIKRGLFTNEAGMGSSPFVHALTKAPSPHFQGTLGLSGVFIDTFFMLSVTAFAILTSFIKHGFPSSPLSGSEAVSIAVSGILGSKGASVFTALSVTLFAFASILGWHISGKGACLYIFGEKCGKLYTVSSLIFVLMGTVLPGGLIWTLTDLFNALMVLTNIPALIKLAETVKTEQKGNFPTQKKYLSE